MNTLLISDCLLKTIFNQQWKYLSKMSFGPFPTKCGGHFSLLPIFCKHAFIGDNQYIPDCVVSIPYDCAEPIPLSSRHWNTPSSCDVTSVILSEDPEIWKRCDEVMGLALKSQVMFGDGFPLATQVKLAEEPGETSWLVRPSVMDTGSVEERPKRLTSPRGLLHLAPTPETPLLFLPYQEHSQYS